jgi:hypothetical protein
MPEECVGKSYHGDLELLATDIGEAESRIIVYCHDCEQEIEANIDLKNADAWFDSS